MAHFRIYGEGEDDASNKRKRADAEVDEELNSQQRARKSARTTITEIKHEDGTIEHVITYQQCRAVGCVEPGTHFRELCDEHEYLFEFWQCIYNKNSCETTVAEMGEPYCDYHRQVVAEHRGAGRKS